MATFGQRLREIRTAHNLTQKDFAKIFKVSESAIGMYERDEREPSIKFTNEVADQFEVTIDYLHGRTDNPKGYETNMSFFGGPEKYTPDEIAEMEAALERYRAMKRRAAEEAAKEREADK
ncbi:helix-turn-helix transcriptional regulator [Paenibacillus sp. Marseille-P2973]|uniref:helix-turn-helix domain-containing protein n=1 Tax=Paenibacillus sp. Marseille-P2973 TaxID=1871032 RepID=UPI001B3793F2|nr:helix-turn-helix transcriptional regulator [Paenibacillus sp. Marseille-P2973]MBQ4899313.1 helix-turn-helix transcriptional regulator [Paenibacillus sp. Marseille-P2973]